MLQKAFISSGVSYHYDLVQPGGPLHDFEVLDLGRLHEVNLNDYSLRSGAALRRRRNAAMPGGTRSPATWITAGC